MFKKLNSYATAVSGGILLILPLCVIPFSFGIWRYDYLLIFQLIGIVFGMIGVLGALISVLYGYIRLYMIAGGIMAILGNAAFYMLLEIYPVNVEKDIIQALKSINQAQDSFKKNLILDMDKDGVGETSFVKGPLEDSHPLIEPIEKFKLRL